MAKLADPFNKPAFPKSKYHEAHTSPMKKGMGDYNGTGVRNKVGKTKDASVGFQALPKKKLKTPPKSVV